MKIWRCRVCDASKPCYLATLEESPNTPNQCPWIVEVELDPDVKLPAPKWEPCEWPHGKES